MVTDDVRAKEWGYDESNELQRQHRAALIVIADNLKGITNVRAISTGSSEGLFFKFDWGAADNFASSVESILADWIVRVSGIVFYKFSA